MKAIVQTRYGPPDLLQVRDLREPGIGADEVRIRVRAAGVDRGVWHLVTGLPYLVRLMYGLRGPGTAVPGLEVAGVVEAVGTRVTRFRPGDEIFGSCEGAYAELAVATEDGLAAKPSGLTFAQAAIVPTSGVTALQVVRDASEVAAGQSALIIGASGGVGTFAVQLAKAAGAHVVGVCSAAKAELVRSLGADEVIDYTSEDVIDGRQRYDVIVDLAGLRSLSTLRRALAPTGTLVIVGGEGGGRWFGGTGRHLRAALLSPFVGQRLRPFFTTPRTEDLDTLRERMEAGEVTPVVDRTFPLDGAAEAIRYMTAGQARGKVALTV